MSLEPNISLLTTLMSLVSFIQAYLHAKNQSQILIHCWNIDNWRILKSHWPRANLAITWELDFSQAYSFHRMLMNHKYFHFKQISDKTNDVIFLKSHIFGPFMTIFGHFCQMGIFSKKSGSATNNYIWAPDTM